MLYIDHFTSFFSLKNGVTLHTCECLKQAPTTNTWTLKHSSAIGMLLRNCLQHLGDPVWAMGPFLCCSFSVQSFLQKTLISQQFTQKLFKRTMATRIFEGQLYFYSLWLHKWQFVISQVARIMLMNSNKFVKMCFLLIYLSKIALRLLILSQTV